MGKNDPVPQTQNSNSRTTQELSPEQRQLLGLAMPGFMQFAASPPKRFGRSSIAGFTPDQMAAQEMARTASNSQDSMARTARDASDFWLSPQVWQPGNNPALQGAIDAATRPITQQLTESILPNIRGGAVTAGYGSSRQGIAEGLASGRASQAVGDTSSKLVSDNYRTNVEAQLRALGLLPQTLDAQTAGARTRSAVGDTIQALDQARLGEEAAGFNYDQLMPFLTSRELLSVLQGIPGGSMVATGQSEASAPQRNRLMGGLGGAMSGASLGSMFGPIGTGIGAIGGGLLGFL